MQPTRGLDMHIGFRRGFFLFNYFCFRFLVFCGFFEGGGRGVVGVVCVFFSLVQLCIIATCNSVIVSELFCLFFGVGMISTITFLEFKFVILKPLVLCKTLCKFGRYGCLVQFL